MLLTGAPYFRAEAAAEEERSTFEDEKYTTGILLQRAELKITSLQKQLDEKREENSELQNLIDKLAMMKSKN